MRYLNCKVLQASDNQNSSGTQIDANQLIAASFQAVFGDTTAAGTFKIQASNDILTTGNPQDFTATNWTDIPNGSVSIISGASRIIPLAQMAYRWIRAAYVSTATGVQTITVHADVAGSLNSKYFLLNSEGQPATSAYYVWLDNGTGVDPMVPGRTGIHVTYTNNATANTLGGLIATAIQAVNGGADFTAANLAGVVTVTNVVAGPFTAASDFNTGFTFAVTGGGTSTVVVNMNALSM